MSLQGMTVAISPGGIQYFTNVLLVDEIVHAIQNLTPPNNTIEVGDILVATTIAQSFWHKNIVVALSSGHLSSFNPTFQSLTQGDNGQFTLILLATNVQANFNWNEQYDYAICQFQSCSTASHENNNYPYSVGFSQMTITIVFQFDFSNNEWQFNFTNASVATTGVSPNIPTSSVVNGQESGGCFSMQVSDATKKAVDTIDFNTPIAALIKPLFSSIPTSGKLTPNIAFQFPIGPSGLTFPGNSGIAAGVTGNVAYKGTAYAGADPPQLALPPVPVNNHLNYYASDYTFNALMWAFFEEGDLVATATPGNIPDPGMLNTSNYNNTPLQALYTAYPNMPMTANIKALVAPAMQFAQIYDLTAANISKLENQLPAAVYEQVKLLKDLVFMSEALFFSALVNALGQANADQFKTPIEAVALIGGAVVTHSNQVILNVVDAGVTIPVITFNVSQTDVLQAFVLGVSGTTQTLQFGFQIVTPLTTTEFVSSTIAGIDSGDFGFIWNFALQPVYAIEVAKIGQAGVALPRIHGFDFLFNNATITLESGYANVLTDVKHVADNGVKYLMSKKLIELDPNAKWEPRRMNDLKVQSGGR
jgi:LBP / BPI / CETP family, C-terminal domain